MIGLDSNVLLRLLLADDPEQTRIAKDLVSRDDLQREGAIRLSDLVLAEVVWVLERQNGYGRATLVRVLEGLIAEPAFAFSDRDRVGAAIERYRRSGAGFSDCLVAAENAAAGCEFTATFDKRMRGLPGVRLL